MSHPVAQIRQKLNISQRELAKQLAMHQHLISCYESWKKHPSVPNAYKIIDFAEKHGLRFNLDDFYIDLR
ncbi:XRE family transcriptional regulator [Candidatus Dojkabacteria bacterium]|uniref:XRE family transcriptional regulator n=1 Tax=Candidatus Dojkabacteria bacterium TaxID=2099670 RepID=A0A5C7J9J6_9BACT|nr:MAG: XRE family transcriptional regulator [Candidatus Dojkabacteria bacterium]